jgi:hypothetical protein
MRHHRAVNIMRSITKLIENLTVVLPVTNRPLFPSLLLVKFPKLQRQPALVSLSLHMHPPLNLWRLLIQANTNL